MNPVAVFLVTVASIFLLGAFGEAVFKRTNVPDVMWLILAGIVLGPITGLVERAQLVAIAPYFAALTLVVVLFEGGSRLNLAELSATAPRSGLLALITFVTAVVVVAAFSMAIAAVGWLPASWTWSHGLLLGSILGGSSSIIIMPAMAQGHVEPKVANLVNLESAFTDAFCVVGASALINLMLGGAGEGSAWLSLGRTFGIGLAIGAGSGLLWVMLLRPIGRSDHAYPMTLSALLLLYVAIEKSGGSAALGILTFAIIVGNARSIGHAIGFAADVELRADVRGFNSQMAFIIKSFFFTFIGAMMSPPWSLIALGVVLGLLLFVARIPGAWLATLGAGLSDQQKRLVVVSMPRGMAAGVLATLPSAAGLVGTESLPTVVFAAVLTTIVVFAVGFPLARTQPTEALPAEALPTESITVNAPQTAPESQPPLSAP